MNELQQVERKVHHLWVFREVVDVAQHAAIQGAANFTPAMLPKLWQGSPCPYSTPLYREAWCRGFYSAACWFLIDRIALLSEAWSPDLGSMFEFYRKSHSTSDWLRVPGGSRVVEELHETKGD